MEPLIETSNLIQIKQADPEDAEIISSIGRKSFRSAFEYLFNDKNELREYLDYTYDTRKISHSICKHNNVFFLAFSDGNPAGFAKVKKHSLNYQVESGAQMELQKIYILPEFHGNGLGSALMNSVFILAQELKPDIIWLDTHISNFKAIAFYEKRGFKKYGKHSFIIGTQTFEYHVMTIPLQSL